ncbi:MAG: PAS domain S-box protein, partial [Ginsengibacter sp.]
RSLVESAPFPIAVYAGKEMEVVLANQSMIKAWGKGDNVVGKKYHHILPELENQEIFLQVENVFNTGIPFHAKNQRIDLESGGKLRPYYFNYSFTPLYDEHGVIYGVMNTAAEVTELNEANQHIEKTLADIKLFKFMADNAGDPFILMRDDGSFAYLNNIAFEKWGYSPEEINQIKVSDVDPIYSPEKFSELFALVQNGSVPTFETIHKSKNGATYPVEVSIGGVHLNGTNFAFAIARDISQRKKSEQQLLKVFRKIEESEKRFRNSVDQAPMGIATFTGKDFIVELANDSYLEIVGKKANDFIAHPLFEVLPELKETVLPQFNDVVETGEPFYASEFVVDLRRNGEIEKAYFNFVYNPIKDENGDITGIMVVATEVTNIVKAKVALQKSEKQFRDMVMLSPIPMAILKGDKYIIDSANQVMFDNVWRKSPEDVLGKSILEAFPELNSQKYPELLQAVFTTANSHSEKEAVAYVEGDDGMKKFYLDFEYAPLFQEDEKVWGIMITVNDVTDMVEARKKVEEAEQRLRLATEFTGVSTWDLDLRTGHIIHSPQLAVLLGHSPTNALSHAALRQQIHPDDVSAIVEKAFDRALETGMYEYEARVVLKDKPIIWIRTQGRVFYDEKMQPIQILGTVRDITKERSYQQELLESESRFRLLADSLPQQIWTADTRGRIFYYNQTVYDFSGLTKEQMEQNGWIQMVHPDEQEENILVWSESIASGSDFLFEHRFRRYDGEYRWQLSRAIPQRDKEGKIQMWVGSSTDIQEIKEQEQQKDYFISMASHELKTPLTSIKGYVQLLQSLHEKGEDSFLKNTLKIIDRQIVTLTKLISELLDVSKIKSGGLDFEKGDFEISELIEEVVTEIKHINPQYEIDIEAKEKIRVHADRNRIGQVLINFLNNAVKYAPQSEIINVKCVRKNDQVVISVQDFGIGINKQDQGKIFERFYRVEGRNEKTFPGFGIGLFIVSEIIKRHNGHIHVESEPGRGSVFTFTIPAILKPKTNE